MAIPDHFIDELLVQTDIVDVVGSRLALKRQGKEFAACCPFHDERSASFFVSPTKQFYHCFGCGAHGTAINFLMNYDRIGFRDAIDVLAQRAGMVVPKDDRATIRNQSEHDALYATLASAALFFQQHLQTNQKSRDYLNERGIDQQISEKFGLGFAPNHYHALSQALAKTPQQHTLLERAGLLSKNDRGLYYDKFRNRLIFPILDRRGRTIAFGGRLISGDSGPKYLNSPETPVFRKSRELYGLWQVRQTNQQIQRLIIVEGYIDVLALFQFGHPYAVATLGTATTSEHVELAFRNADALYFCFDGDAAGRKAAWKAVESALPCLKDGRQAFFLFLPEGDDPDSILRREGKNYFEERLQQALPLSRFFFDTLKDGIAIDTLDGRARLHERARPLLARLPQGAFSDMMAQHLAELTKYRLSAPLSKQANIIKPTTQTAPEVKNKSSVVRAILTLLIQQPSLGLDVKVSSAISKLRQPGISILFEILELIRQRPTIQTGTLLEHFQSHNAYRHLCALAMKPIVGTSDQLKQILIDAFSQLERQYLRQRIQELMLKRNSVQLDSTDKYELRELLRAQAALR